MYKIKLIFAVFSLVLLGCKDNNREKKTEIKVISPYNCEYSLLIVGSNLHIQSKSIFVSKQSVEQAKIDTIVNRYDTILNSEDITKLVKLNETITYGIDSTTAHDAYRFELLINDTLVKDKNGHDKEIYLMLNVIKPYIKKEKIQCCDFFTQFE